jgi:hypothetical protein
VGLELRVVLQGRVAGVAQEGEHLLCTQRDLKVPVFFSGHVKQTKSTAGMRKETLTQTNNAYSKDHQT